MDIYAVSDRDMDLYVSHHFPCRIRNYVRSHTGDEVPREAHRHLSDMRDCRRYGICAVCQSVRTCRSNGQCNLMRGQPIGCVDMSA